ncbi:hypothetical protein COBT_000819 [Conglomerata obtusa]
MYFARNILVIILDAVMATTLSKQITQLQNKIQKQHEAEGEYNIEISHLVNIVLGFNFKNEETSGFIEKFLEELSKCLEIPYCITRAPVAENYVCKNELVLIMKKLLLIHEKTAEKEFTNNTPNSNKKSLHKNNSSYQEFDLLFQQNKTFPLLPKTTDKNLYFVCNYYTQTDGYKFIVEKLIPFIDNDDYDPNTEYMVVSCLVKYTHIKIGFIENIEKLNIGEICSLFIPIFYNEKIESFFPLDTKTLEKYKNGCQVYDFNKKIPTHLGLRKENNHFSYIALDFSILITKYIVEIKNYDIQYYKETLKNLYKIEIKNSRASYTIVLKYLHMNTVIKDTNHTQSYICMHINDDYEQKDYFKYYDIESNLIPNIINDFVDQNAIDSLVINYDSELVNDLFNYFNLMYLNPNLWSDLNHFYLPKISENVIFSLVDFDRAESLSYKCMVSKLSQMINSLIKNIRDKYNPNTYLLYDCVMDDCEMKGLVDTPLRFFTACKYIQTKSIDANLTYDIKKLENKGKMFIQISYQDDDQSRNYYICCDIWIDIIKNFVILIKTYNKSESVGNENDISKSFIKTKIDNYYLLHKDFFDFEEVTKFILNQFTDVTYEKFIAPCVFVQAYLEKFVELMHLKFLCKKYQYDPVPHPHDYEAGNVTLDKIKSILTNKEPSLNLNSITKIEECISMLHLYLKNNRVTVNSFSDSMGQIKKFFEYLFISYINDLKEDMSTNIKICVYSSKSDVKAKEFEDIVKSSIFEYKISNLEDFFNKITKLI